MKFVLLILVVSFIGCSTRKEPPSAIVQKAQFCGAGELSGTSMMALRDWFSKHRDCAVAVDGVCKPVRDRATADWADSTEGRVCIAARNVAQWVRKPSQDHETFQGGLK
ncbi:MAG TPA: hypothetical protein VHZ07_23845 [Bryobacteraceae bacterium]|jgi:hypothetical protein|nr:hypothetical protein [Bryobacteraceae bacterium]